MTANNVVQKKSAAMLRLEAKAAEVTASNAAVLTAPVMHSLKLDDQMSLAWTEKVRAVPNAILRGALFGVNQVRTHHAKFTQLASTEGVEVQLQGDTFTQTDLTVLESLLHVSRDQPMGGLFGFTSHALLKELKRGKGKAQYNQLAQELERFRINTMRFRVSGAVLGDPSVKRDVFYGNIFKHYSRRERFDGTHEHVVAFDEKVIDLYGLGYTEIDWKQRLALKSNLAQWLHGMLNSHVAPYPYKVETYKNLSGSTSGRLTDFRKMLRKALSELVKIGVITSWDITDDDLVEIVKPMTPSQQRYRVKKLSEGTKVPSRKKEGV